MKSFKTKLKPNNKQRTMFLQHCGVARHAWNWGLDVCKDKLAKNEKLPSAIDLHKLLVKEVKSVNPWYYKSSKCAPQQALRNLPDAFSRFWKQHKTQKGYPAHKKYLKKYILKHQRGEISSLSWEHEKGFPKYKKRGDYDSFYLEQHITIMEATIVVPRIGRLKTYEILPDGVMPKSVVISRVADDWFISFQREAPQVKTASNTSIGVDLGINTLATMSNGTAVSSPKPYKIHKAKLRRLQLKLCRQRESAKANNIKPGTNYAKTKSRLAKVHQRISNIRKDAIHKLTTSLVKNHNRIVIEDLNVQGMTKNHNLASAILDGGFYEFRRQLAYKCTWYGVKLVIADRWFASSKTCSRCGHKQDMPLKKRTYICECCCLILDRDLNAAINLNNYTPSSGVKACGDTKFHAEKQVGVGETGIRQQVVTTTCISS